MSVDLKAAQAEFKRAHPDEDVPDEDREAPAADLEEQGRPAAEEIGKAPQEADVHALFDATAKAIGMAKRAAGAIKGQGRRRRQVEAGRRYRQIMYALKQIDGVADLWRREMLRA